MKKTKTPTNRSNRVQTEIFKKIDSYKKYAIKLQESLIKIPSISPQDGGKGEYDKAQVLLKELKKLKFDQIKIINAPDKRAKKGVRPSIVAIYEGKNSNKTLWIMSHTDTVAASNPEQWKTPPFKAVVKGDKIYGRGSQDNNQGIVSSLLTTKALIEIGQRPPVNVGLLFTADEENGSKFGIEHILAKHRKLFSKNDMFIIPDAGNSSGTFVEIAEKSMLWFKFTVTGKAAHSSDPHLAVNSLNAAGHLIVNLEKLNKKFGKSDKVFVPPASSFECTKIESNASSVNSIPGETIIYADCRILPNYKLSAVEKEVKHIAKQTAQKHKVKIKVETINYRQTPKPTSVKADIVKLILPAVKKVYRAKPKPQGIGGGTIATFTRKAGFDTVVYQRNDMMDHMIDEYCKISNMLGDAKVFACAIMEIR